MAQNRVAVGRDQWFLMPPSLQEWRPENNLAWNVLVAVPEMDLSAFMVVFERIGEVGPRISRR